MKSSSHFMRKLYIMITVGIILVNFNMSLANNINWRVKNVSRQRYLFQYMVNLGGNNKLDRAFIDFHRSSAYSDEDSCGIKDIIGVEIIGLERGYQKIDFLHDSIYGGFFEFTKVQDGKLGEGICDLNGKEIIPFINDIDFITFFRNQEGTGYFMTIKEEDDKSSPVGDFGTIIYQGIYDLDGKNVVPLTKAGSYSIFNKSQESYLLPYELILKKLNKTVKKNSQHTSYYKNLAKQKIRLYKGIDYSSIKYETTYTEKNGFSWILVKQGNKSCAKDIWGEIIIPMGDYIIQYSELSDGLSCFKIEEPTFRMPRKGVLSLSGKTIVPYDHHLDIQYCKAQNIGGYFKVSKILNKSIVKGVYMLNGNNIISTDNSFERIIYSIENGNFGYFEVMKNDCYGAYDIYGNCIIPLGTKGNELHYGKKGFYFANDRKYLGIQIDEYGAADYSLRKEWDRQAREKEEERRRKKEQRRNFWTNFGNALAQSALGYLGMQSQHMMPMGAGFNMPSSTYNQTAGPLAQQMSQPGYFNNVYQELMFTSMVQVQQQEMWEYNQARQGALAMGKDLTFDEWRCQRGAAIQALKEQGVDIIAEQNERNRQNNREWRESLSQDSKDRLQRIKDYNQMKYGTSSGSSSISSTNRKSGQLSHSTSQWNNASSYNTTSYPQTSTNRNNSVSNANTQTKPSDSHQQYKNGNKNVSSSDYTYIQRVTLYRQDGSSFRVAKQNAELYEKGATEYIKIGGTFFPAQNPGKVTGYRKRIVYGGVGLYYN